MAPLLKRSSQKDGHEEILQTWVAKDLPRFTKALQTHQVDLDYIYQDYLDYRLLELTAMALGCDDFVQAVLSKGAKVNQVNPATGKVALHIAAESINAGVVGLLLKAGADPNIQDLEGDTPLHALIKKWEQGRPSSEETLQLLLNHTDIAVNVPNITGHTPISLAAALGEAEVVAALLRLGSALDLDTFRCKEDNKTSREVILKNFPGLEEELPGSWEPDPGKGLIDYKFRLFYFLTAGQEIKFCKNLRNAMDVTQTAASLLTSIDGQHYTYLQHSSEKGYTKAVRMLLKYGADVNFAQLSTDPPLVLAARNGHNEVFSVLLSSAGVDLSPNDQGETLLHIAVKTRGRSFGHYSILRRLVRHPEIDVNARDFKGRTALHFAVTYADERSIFLLLDSGARLDAPNNFGETPLRQLSSSTLRKYLDGKISTNCELPKHSDYGILFDYKFALSRKGTDHIYGMSTDLLISVSKSPELRELLSHPIYSTIILFKWQRIRMFFYLDLFFYTLFCVLLTSYVFFGPQMTASYDTCKNLTDSNTTNDKEMEPPHRFCYDKDHYTLAAEAFLLLFLAVLAISEIFQCLTEPTQYFKSIENWLQIAVVFSSVISIILGCPQDPKSFSHCNDISAFAIFFAWFEFFFVIGKHPKLTFFIDMFRTASLFLLQFLAVHTSLILSFVFSFYVLFRDFEGPFTTIQKSFFKTLIMITGEYEVGEIPLDSAPGTSHLLFATFLFLIAIVLFNLLIGLAVSATRPIEDDAFLYSCIAQVPIISFFENIFFNDSHFLKRMHTKLLKCTKRSSNGKKNVTYPVLLIFPNQKNRMEIRYTSDHQTDSERRIHIRHHLTKKIVQDTQYILTNKQDAQNTGCDKLDDLKQQMESTQAALEDELRTIKTALVEILEKFEGQETEGDADGQNMRRKRAKADLVLKKLRSYGQKLEQRHIKSHQSKDNMK